MDLLNIEETIEKTIKKDYGVYQEFLIVDNFLDDYNLKTLQNIIENRFNGNDSENNPPIVSWHTSIGFHPYNYTHWSTKWEDDFFKVELLDKIKEITKKKLEVKRVYTSFQGIGEFGLWHTDDNGDDDYTFTLYLAITKNPYSETRGCEGGNFLNLRFLREQHYLKMMDKTKIFPTMLQDITNKGRNTFYNSDNSIFKINNYKNEYSKLNYVPLKSTDSEKVKIEKKEKMINIRDNFKKYDTGGDFMWIKDGYIKTSPFVVNRGVFFNSKELHTGDCFRLGESSILSHYERIVVSFKLKEII